MDKINKDYEQKQKKLNAELLEIDNRFEASLKKCKNDGECIVKEHKQF